MELLKDLFKFPTNAVEKIVGNLPEQIEFIFNAAFWLVKGAWSFNYFYDGPDPLQTKVYRDVNIWILSHSAVYFLIGRIYPGRFFQMLAVGTIFEIYEWFMGNYFPTFWPEQFKKQAMDVIFNQIGYVLGSIFATNTRLLI